MHSFTTKIVRTWQPSKWLRTVGSILLVASAICVFVWKPDILWIKILSYIVYGITFLFALSLSFIKSKTLGEMFISEDSIEIDLDDEKRDFQVSELEELGLDYRGYGNFWKYTIQGNKNHFYFRNKAGEKFDYEILIQNKEKKENLKQLLNEIKAVSKIKVERTGLYSF